MIEQLIRPIENIKPDHLFFTGDYYADGYKLAQHFNIGWTGVIGNCDFRKKGRKEQQVTYAGKKVLLVHGHQYGIKRSLNSLYYKAQETGVDLVLFGHTHVPMCEQVDGIWFINPGSASLPRYGSHPSYALIDFIDDNIIARIIEI